MAQNTIHPFYVRAFHWLNAIAVFMMVGSGWRIYNAAPVFAFRFPEELTLGNWLGGALQWHFAAMWLFVINLGVYLGLGLINGHFLGRMFPLSPRQVLADLSSAAHFKLAHRGHEYNAVQKASYLGVILAMVMTIVSGMVVWKPVQFQALSWMVGNYDKARVVHFAGMALICAFIAVHLALVLVVPSTFLPMITGRARSLP